MSQMSMKIISAVIAAVLAVGMLAACGIMKPDTPSLPEEDLEIVTPKTADEELPTEELASPIISEEMPEAVTAAPQKEEPVTSAAAETAPWMKQEYSQKIVDVAIAQLGVPFELGGDDPDEGFDTSGLTYYCVNEAGIKFPRALEDQLNSGEKVSYDQMAAGDIAYFSLQPGGEAAFCGVYVGGGLMIYAPVPDEFVKTANITTNYWVTHFVTGLRVTAER